MCSAELQPAWAGFQARRFAVAWRNRVLRERFPVGVLEYDHETYRFEYLPDVAISAEGFRPFVGFPDLYGLYESPRLWPFFSLRVMDRKRSDFAEYVRWLGLPPDASVLDILSRSGGEQKGDSVSMAEAPAIAPDGRTSAEFLIRGASYAVRSFGTECVANGLIEGDRLNIVDDSDNEANPNALLFETSDGSAIGWVPDLLIDYVRDVRVSGGSAHILQNNGLQAPWHARLLVSVSGRLSPDRMPFTGDPWPAEAH